MSSPAHVMDSVRATGLLEPGTRVVVLLSGGADSVCLLHVLRELLGSQALLALHVNHRLRPAADDDERFCVELCDALDVGLAVERPELGEKGNLEARARDARYRAAERLRERDGLARIATGHTSSDQVETIVYRLAASPGRRALLGMSPLKGRLIRPLLGVTREQTRAYCKSVGLEWCEDETNLDPRFARNRVRLDVLPALREIHPAAEQNVLATADQLQEEADMLESAVDEALQRVAAGGRPPSVEVARLRELSPALRRLVLRRLAEQAAGEPLALRGERVREIEQLATRGGSASIDLGSGVRALAEYGVIRFQRQVDEQAPEPASLTVPGRCRFGDWQMVCETEPGGAGAFAEDLGSPDEAVLDRDKLASELRVRSWSEGDRMRPLGLTGTKSLQDLFTDCKVPRSLRHLLPVVESAGEIAWVAGVAVSDLFKVTGATRGLVRLRARTAPSRGRSEP